MRKLVTFILLFIIQSNISFASYNGKPVTMSDRHFDRYGLRQLNNILNDYYRVLKLLNPESTPFVEVTKEIILLKHDWDDHPNKCKEEILCDEFIDKIHMRSLKLHSLLARALSSAPPSKKKPFQSYEYDTELTTLTNLTTIYNINNILMMRLEDLKISIEPVSRREFLELNRHIFELDTKSKPLITMKLDSDYERANKAVWVNFLKPLYEEVILHKNKQALLNNLNDFTSFWNTYHHNMAKANLDSSKEVVQLVYIMHQRWNSILKMILRK